LYQMYFAARLPSQAHTLHLEAWARKSCAEHVRPAPLEVFFRRAAPTSLAALHYLLRNMLAVAGEPLAEKGWLRVLSAGDFGEALRAQAKPAADVGEEAQEPAPDTGKEAREPDAGEAAHEPATAKGEAAQGPATDAGEEAPTEAVETRHGTSCATAAPAGRADLLVIEFASLVSADFVQRAAEMRSRLLGE